MANQKPKSDYHVFMSASHWDEGWLQEATEYHERGLAISEELRSPRAEDARKRLEELEGN